MRRHAAMCLVSVLLAGSAWGAASTKTPPEPQVSFDRPPAEFTYQPFMKGREPQTPGVLASTSRRELDRKASDQPLKILIPAKGGTTILADSNRRSTMFVDVDGDKKYRGKQENLNLGREGYYGPTHAVIKWPDGTRMYYGFVIYPPPRDSSGGRYNIERYGAMTGKLEGEIVQIVDDDSNGMYDDYGTDVIIVGKKPPVYLGKMIMLKGELYHLKVSPAGHRVYLAKYKGKTGKVDLLSGYKAASGFKLVSAAIKEGTRSFDALGDAKNPVVAVPEGKYELATGAVRKFNIDVPIVTGNMKPVEIKAGVPAAVPKWGKPFKLDFKVESKIMGITLSEVGIYGAGGEKYLTPKDPPPFVVISGGGRSIPPKQMTYGPDGQLAEFFFDPQRSGNYQVLVIQQSKVFGRLSSDKKPVRFVKKF